LTGFDGVVSNERRGFFKVFAAAVLSNDPVDLRFLELVETAEKGIAAG
jgi:hypothetical protein